MNTVQQVQNRAWIKFLKELLSGIAFDIVQPIMTVGCHKSNDITILDQSVSRFHTRLLWDSALTNWSLQIVSAFFSVRWVQLHLQPEQCSPVSSFDVAGSDYHDSCIRYCY
jgi:hypothetical protein